MARNRMAVAFAMAAICLIAILLSSCAPLGLTDVNPPDFTPSIIVQSQTETPIRIHTQTFTLTPAFEDIYPTMEPTLAALYTQAEIFPKDCKSDNKKYYHGNPFMISPDGNWLAEECASGIASELRLLNIDGTTRKIITYQGVFGDQRFSECCNSIFPIHWSRDSQYIYFTTNRSYWDSVYPPYLERPFFDGALYKLNLQSGEWSKITGGTEGHLNYFSFSPTDRRVLYPFYSAGRQLSIKILDLKSGLLLSIPLPGFFDSGAVVWSPDGQAFAFTASKLGENDDYEHQEYTVFIYNSIIQVLRNLISDTTDRRICSEWTNENILIIPLIDPDNYPQSMSGHTLYFSVNANSFITFTPSPTP